MRVLWVSDLGCPTGFARVSHSVIKFIKDRLDITGFGINYKGVPHKLGIDLYPAATNQNDPMGFSKIAATVSQGDYDVIFILQDAWVIDNYLGTIKAAIDKDKIPPIVVYFPVDAEEHDPDWYKNFDIVTKAVVYTEFGKKTVQEVAPDLKLEIIPHGNDKEVFFKKFDSRDDAKKILFKGRDSYPDFLVLNANRNQPRKRLDITLRGFKIFAEGKDDVALYMHCGVTDASIAVDKLAMKLDIDDKIVMSNLNHGPQAVSEEDLNLFYNAADVGINTSMGEGWGLTSSEHAMTGAIQIVPDHSACTELFGDVGILMPTVADYTFDGVMTKGKLVSPEALAEALETVYNDRKAADALAEKAFEKFSSEEYEWETIAERWYKILKSAVSVGRINNLQVPEEGVPLKKR